jgi:hypothetical protein
VSFAPPRRLRWSAITALLALLGLVVVAGALPAAAASSLNAGSALACASLHSTSGQYEAAMQCDGNLVVYGPGGPIWSSRTNNTPGTSLEVQTDGNLVLYGSGHVPVWSTNTTGSGASLVMQDDGNLVLYSSNGATWASKANSEGAINWFYDHRGATNYEGLCEKAVENAFGRNAVYPSARANWNARDHNTPFSAAPRGTLVFYNTSASAHVAISLGNGRVFSTSAAGGRIDISPIGWFQNPLGWGHSPW